MLPDMKAILEAQTMAMRNATLVTVEGARHMLSMYRMLLELWSEKLQEWPRRWNAQQKRLQE